MARWDYDTVFYRVLCSALLVVALTFTVILTNVFIDIDGMLYKKNKAITEKIDTEKADVDVPADVAPNDDYIDYGDYYGERTKRSLDTQDYDLHIKDPNMKKVISDHLAALLDDLDKEESQTNKIKEPRDDHTSENYIYTNTPKVDNNYKPKIEVFDTRSDKFREKNTKMDYDTNYKSEFELFDTKKIKYEPKANDKENIKDTFNNVDMKHMTMHNIILQGIVGHMELGDVYRKVHAFYHNYDDNQKEVHHPHHEKLFFNELATCERLQKEVLEANPQQTSALKKIKPSTEKPSGRNVMIKTIIDINSQTNEKTNQDASKENVFGIIKVIYNGKILKFKRIDESTTIKPKLTKINENMSSVDINRDNIKNLNDKVLNADKSTTYVPNAFMNKMISEYFKRLSKQDNLDDNKKITTKRLKRHIKIRYENDHKKVTTETPKQKEEKDEDELFVEIETHFDSKGMKGAKKKKFIAELIEKIQKAIHSDSEAKKKKHKHLHVKRRTQNPLDNVNTASIVKTSLNHLTHRDMDPISKSVPMHNKLPLVTDDKGDEWRKKIYGPGFLTATKSINSAEMSEVDADYNKLLNNGIPQRLQQPLNSETVDSIVSPDLSKSQFVLRDIAGSGFSIGFNQYVGEPPDAESMKFFNGLENILQTYHQNYDEDGGKENADNPPKQEIFEEPENYEYPAERDNHMIVRRSVEKLKQDYHSNEYKLVYNKNFLNYNNYQDIYNGKDKSDAKSSAKSENLFLDENIFNKELKPAEIFKLADMLERQKRFVTVKKISNIKNKKKLNRYINTKSMASKKIFQQNKRNKRQIGKIRIIAKDISDNNNKHPDEDIFFFSDDKVLADRAMVKEVEIPELEPKETNHGERFIFTPHHPPHDHYDVIPPEHISEHFKIISPQKVTENHYDIISPYMFEPSDTSDTNSIFTRKSRHNSLMSRYPHLFMEESSKFKEDLPDSQMAYENIEEKNKVNPTTLETQETVEQPKNNLRIQELKDYPSQEKSNYKVTVKFIPKNNTGPNSGFKEIHTSINKSYDKNGLKYSSLVNVTEISRVEKINHTKEHLPHPSVNKMKRDQMKIQYIIQQHKSRIEDQLAHLKKEKEKLNGIDNLNAQLLKDIPKDYVELAAPENLEKTLYVTKEDIGRMYKVKTTTEQATTAKYVQQEDPDKLKIIHTIERNENITNEILKKIDKTTNILQTFLNKLLMKLEPKTQKAESNTKEDNKTKPQTVKTNDMYDNLSQILFNQKNITGIPFIYAFQQQNKISNIDESKTVPIANIVYQGHIHTETIKPELTRRSRANNEVKNSSKFFIDDIEEYKVLPVVGKTEFTTNVTKI